MDQTTEITVNKDTQIPRGASWFSLKAGAIKRYYITAEHCSGFLGQLRGMVQGRTSGVHHAELQPSGMKKDEEAVSSVADLIQGWVNLFSEKEAMRSVSRVIIAFKEERLEKRPTNKNLSSTNPYQQIIFVKRKR